MFVVINTSATKKEMRVRYEEKQKFSFGLAAFSAAIFAFCIYSKILEAQYRILVRSSWQMASQWWTHVWKRSLGETGS
jgi:hypothetical protein